MEPIDWWRSLTGAEVSEKYAPRTFRKVRSAVKRSSIPVRTGLTSAFAEADTLLVTGTPLQTALHER